MTDHAAVIRDHIYAEAVFTDDEPREEQRTVALAALDALLAERDAAVKERDEAIVRYVELPERESDLAIQLHHEMNRADAACDRAEAAKDTLTRYRNALDGMEADADAILGTTGKLGLAETPGNEIPDEAYNLACRVREARAALDDPKETQ